MLLVTEPTPFGLNDLRLAVEMTRALGVPFGVAVNRSGEEDGAVLDYCAAERIPVLLEMPDDPEIARAYSRGELALAARPELRPRLLRLYEQLVELSLVKAPACPRPLAAPAVEPTARGEPPPVQLGSGGDLHQLVVVSGKGGTGKTSIVASFFALAAGRAAVADCDVDAADLHLVLSPAVLRRRPFSGGSDGGHRSGALLRLRGLRRALSLRRHPAARGRCARLRRRPHRLRGLRRLRRRLPGGGRTPGPLGQRGVVRLRDPARPDGPRAPGRRAGEQRQAGVAGAP